MENPEELEYGAYCIKSAVMEGTIFDIRATAEGDYAVLEKQVIETLSEETHTIEITLGKREK